tara:strand:- start:1618 stop:1875 length:258 start_codon:yes stop_codon:yes gene_type:complete
MESKFILFTSPQCSFCEKALELLDGEKKRYDVVLFKEEQQEVLNKIKSVYDWETVPMIFCRTKNVIDFIGGYTDLAKYLEQEKAK